MHAIPLRIPRTFFANLLAPPSHPLVADMGVLARRALPHGAAAATLVQIVMDEASFRAEQAALNERLLALRALRVYEDTLPPTYNACLQVRRPFVEWLVVQGGLLACLGGRVVVLCTRHQDCMSCAVEPAGVASH